MPKIYSKLKKAIILVMPYFFVKKHKDKQQAALKEKQHEEALRKTAINKAIEQKKKEKAKILKAEQEKLIVFNNRVNSNPNKEWGKYYAKHSLLEPIENNWILWESHAGSGMVCNPYAIFKAFLNRPDFNNYIHYWVIKNESEIELLKEEYKEYDNIYFIKPNSYGYAYFLAKCKYLINNTSFPACFSKRKDQIFLNTWHSITVKSLGFDIPDGKLQVRNMLRNFLASDYILSPNEFMRDIYDNSFRLRNIYKGKYIEEGYPRNDLVFNTERQYIIDKLCKRGTNIDPNKKIILYAPTWSGNSVNEPDMNLNKYNELNEYLKTKINTDEYQILIKPHQFVYRNLSQEEINSGKYISYSIDANELLSITDILITDYSSIYFDYTVADKPILFYIPNYEDYTKQRGIYFKLDELPGPCSFELESLAENINNIDKITEEYAPIRHKTMEWANKYDDGNVASRILNIIFSNIDGSYNIINAKNENKKSILFYIGGLNTNGMTTAAVNLFKRIDYDKYDISLFTLTKDEQAIKNILSLDDRIRVFMRCGAPVHTKTMSKIYKSSLANAFLTDQKQSDKLSFIFKREYSRCFGDTMFDYYIDFSGYGALFPLITLFGDENHSKKHYIWQHSNMLLDMTNTEKRKLSKNAITLEGLGSIYQRSDKIVSVSKPIFEINRKNISTPETVERFTYVTNLLDNDQIQASLLTEQPLEIANHITVLKEKYKNGIMETMLYPFKQSKTAIKFVTVGRCMPEKNHANIIKAIKMLADNSIDAYLYIIGDGHLRDELEQLAENLNITNRIIITGMLENPFALLKKCDCFVFPSFYEAHPMAVLEARAAKLPIIISNYDAVKSVCIENKQFILKGTEAEDIYEGMCAFINGKIPNDYKFDIEEYNKKALSEFEALF